jgi:hypothetical protein
MIPTTRFRYIERSYPMHPFYKMIDSQGRAVDGMQTVRILQQWWGIEEDLSIGEWRDIPLEEET